MSCHSSGAASGPPTRTPHPLPDAFDLLPDAFDLLPDAPDALDPGFHCVRTPWIRGFMAFRMARRTRTVMLTVPV